MYEFESNVRFSEVDADGKLQWLALLDYFQDSSVAHSENLHVGNDYLRAHDIAWLLIGWQIHLERRPHLCDKIHIQTWPYSMKDFYGKRNFRMVDEKGEILAYADSTWVMINLANGHPVKIPKEVIEAYEYEEPIPMESMGRKLKVPTEYRQMEGIVVPPYFIDTNHHMNNGRYLQVALSYLPEGFMPKTLQVEYRKEALLGDILYPRVTVEEEAITVVLTDEGGKPYSILKFLK